MTNPFAPPAPAVPAPAPAPAPGNPFGQPAAPAAPQAFAPPQAPPAAPAPAPQAFGNPGAQGSSAWPVGAAPAAAAAPPALPTSIGQAAQAPTPTTGGGTGANLRAMYGRLVLVFPRGIERGLVSSRFKDVKTQQPLVYDRMTATFVVLDGPNPIAFGGDPYSMPPVPHTKSEPLPHVSPGLWVDKGKLIEQCSGALAQTQAGGVGMVLGRLVKAGADQNSPWILEPYTEQDKATADYYLAGVASDQFPNPLAA